ncbi:MAG: hypothetical protein QME66_09925 [Candidatus Eisenbacteria bacterium]|nr:hypothetical protein [Candidatus Eisenbacteria bacterium]
MGFEITSKESPLFLAVGLILILLSFLAYRNLTPPLSSRWKWTLGALRILAFLTVAVTLIRPIVSYVHKPKPQVGILLDVSESMSLPTSPGPEAPQDTRLEMARKVLGELLKESSGKIAPRVFFFAGETSEVASFEKAKVESMKVLTARTSIARALEKVSKEMWDASSFVILGDGVDNGDIDPLEAARKMGVPVHVMDPGGQGELADAEVSEVRSSPEAFLGAKIEIASTIRATGLHGREATVLLSEGGRVLSSKKIMLPDSFREEEVKFETVPQEPGIHFFQIEIPKLSGEFVVANNKKAFAVDVLKESTRLLYCEGKLSWDFTFLKRNLEKEKGLSTVFLVLERDGKWRCYGERPVFAFPKTAAELKEFDVLILGDLPVDEIRREEDKVLDFLKEGKGVLVLGGRDPSGVQRFQHTKLLDALPVLLRRGPLSFPEQYVNPKLTDKGKSHLVTAIGENTEDTQTLWQDLPPIVSPAGSVFPKEGSEVLVEGQIPGFPLIIAGRYGLGRILVINANSIWRWDLLAGDLSGTNVVFTRLVSDAVQWLSEKEAGKKLNIKPEKDVYGRGEEITFSGWLKDIDYRPIKDANIKVSVGRKTLVLNPDEEAGSYSRTVELPPGRYSYEILAARGNEELARDKGELLVEDTGAEMRRLGTGADLLRRISEVTGGKFFTQDKTLELAREIVKSARLSYERREFDVWRSPAPFILLLLFLGLEWTIRRRFGLP